MAGDINVLVHRERVPASTGSWQVRPTGLSGITPVAVWAFCTVANSASDDSALSDAGFCFGVSDGTDAYCNGYTSEDTVATSNSMGCGSGADLLYLRNHSGGSDELEIDVPSFVSGGCNVNVATNTVRPHVNFVFFYGADFQFYMERTAGIASGTRTITHSFSANSDNQLCIFLRANAFGTPSNTKWSFNTRPPNIGMAYRDGAAGAPDGQASVTHWSSGGRANCLCYDNAYSTHCIRNPGDLGIPSTAYECTDISDTTITLTHRSGAGEFGCYTFVMGTDNKKLWAGLSDSPTTSTWTFSSPNFTTQLAFAIFTQCANDQSSFETTDIGIWGAWAGDDSTQGAATCSDEDGAADMVAKNLQSAKLNVLEDDGTVGWTAASAGDFSLTSTGWEVTNVTGPSVTGARKWLLFALEGAATATNVDVPLATFTLTGQVPTVAGGAAVAVPLATFTLTGQVPAVAGGAAVAVPLATFTLTGQIPTIEAGGGISVQVPLATFTLTGQVPTVAGGAAVAVPLATFTITGQVPTIEASAALNIAVPLATFTLTGQVPTVAAGAAVAVPLATFTLTGQVPTISISGLVEALPSMTIETDTDRLALMTHDNVTVEFGGVGYYGILSESDGLTLDGGIDADGIFELQMRTSDIVSAGIGEDDTVTISGTVYAIGKIDNIAGGMSVLHLEV